MNLHLVITQLVTNSWLFEQLTFNLEIAYAWLIEVSILSQACYYFVNQLRTD